MTDVFLERVFDPPIDRQSVLGLAEDSAWCFEQYRVDWHGSLLSMDGRRMLCRFSSADAESTRAALRQAGSELSGLWHGTVHEAPVSPGIELPRANVAVSRQWDEPVTLETIQAIEDEGAWCLEAHRVTFVRSYFSADRKRMVCLYNAPDAESVRLAQKQASMPVEEVWAFEEIKP